MPGDSFSRLGGRGGNMQIEFYGSDVVKKGDVVFYNETKGLGYIGRMGS